MTTSKFNRYKRKGAKVCSVKARYSVTSTQLEVRATNLLFDDFWLQECFSMEFTLKDFPLIFFPQTRTKYQLCKLDTKTRIRSRFWYTLFYSQIVARIFL